jgi:hypothetical protein
MESVALAHTPNEVREPGRRDRRDSDLLDQSLEYDRQLLTRWRGRWLFVKGSRLRGSDRAERSKFAFECKAQSLVYERPESVALRDHVAGVVDVADRSDEPSRRIAACPRIVRIRLE